MHYTSFNGCNELNGRKAYSEPKIIWFVTQPRRIKKHVKFFTFFLPQNIMATQAKSEILTLIYKLEVTKILIYLMYGHFLIYRFASK